MPTIKARKQASGITRYTAIVRIRRGGLRLGFPDECHNALSALQLAVSV